MSLNKFFGVKNRFRDIPSIEVKYQWKINISDAYFRLLISYMFGFNDK